MSRFSLLGRPDVRNVPVYIYALTEPDTGEVRYVGKSSNPAARLAYHQSPLANLGVYEWCGALDAEGKAPALVILHTVPPGEDSDPWECRFIAQHRGPRLLNVHKPHHMPAHPEAR